MSLQQAFGAYLLDTSPTAEFNLRDALQSEADAKARFSVMGRTLLHYAFMRNHVHLADALIKLGAGLREQDANGLEPWQLLHPAASCGDWYALIAPLFESGVLNANRVSSHPAIQVAWDQYRDEMALKAVTRGIRGSGPPPRF